MDIKQEIIRINNSLNMNMYGIGLRRQRVLIIDEQMIVILADNKRIPALSALDKKDRFMTRVIDVALLEDFKQRLKEELQAKLNFKIRAIFKDYDPASELAVTTILLKTE